MTLLQAFASVSGMTFLSRLFGLARDVTLAAVFGATVSADAFFAAFRLPNTLRRFTAEGALTQAFVPAYAQAQKESDRQAAKLAGETAAGLGLLLLFISVLLCDCGALDYRRHRPRPARQTVGIRFIAYCLSLHPIHFTGGVGRRYVKYTRKIPRRRRRADSFEHLHYHRFSVGGAAFYPSGIRPCLGGFYRRRITTVVDTLPFAPRRIVAGHPTVFIAKSRRTAHVMPNGAKRVGGGRDTNQPAHQSCHRLVFGGGQYFLAALRRPSDGITGRSFGRGFGHGRITGAGQKCAGQTKRHH